MSTWHRTSLAVLTIALAIQRKCLLVLGVVVINAVHKIFGV